MGDVFPVHLPRKQCTFRMPGRLSGIQKIA
jgi:hypothetical protein